MNKVKIAEIIAEKFKTSKKLAENIVESIFNEFIAALSRGEKVNIVGFGSFMTKKRHARKGVDPRNPSKIIDIPETKVAKFKAGKRLKDSIRA